MLSNIYKAVKTLKENSTTRKALAETVLKDVLLCILVCNLIVASSSRKTYVGIQCIKYICI